MTGFTNIKIYLIFINDIKNENAWRRNFTQKRKNRELFKKKKRKNSRKLNKYRFPPAQKEIQAQPLREQESEAQEEKKEAPKKKQYLPVNQHSKNFGNQRRGVGIAAPDTPWKKTATKHNTFTVTTSDM